MAKKYIDAERLKAEIEKRLKNVRDYMAGVGMRYKGPKYYKMQGKESAYDALLNIIGSLQQEQPEPTCKSCGFYENNCPFIRNTFKPYPNKICKDYTYSVMKEQEQPEVDLENEIKDTCRGYRINESHEQELGKNDIENIARYFYELGLKAKEESK